MNYRKLLVGLADTETAPRVMAAAAAIAAAQEAHLLGVHVVPSGVVRESGVPVDDLAERLRRVHEAHCDGEAFTSEWQVLSESALSAGGALVELGGACDVLVLGQRHAREAGRLDWHLGEHVVGVSARPVLLVPDGGARAFSTERILVGWDGGAAATRAVFDALPLLERASSVRVHRFNPPSGERAHVSALAEELAATLARHDVAVELSHADAPPRAVGAELLSLAEELDADLLVSGCRVHGRLRDSLLGSTTRHLFANASRPLLMAG